MTTGQQNKKTLSSSYSNGMTSKACSLRKKGLSLPTSTLRPWKPGMSAFSKTQSSLLMSSSSSTNKSTNKMKRTVSPVLGSTFMTSEFALKQGTPIVISKPGVYFENRRLYDTRHPAQAMYNPFLVSKMPAMPIGTPLATPPPLAFAKSGPLPFGVPSPQPTRRKSPPTRKTVIESSLRPSKNSLHTRRVSMDKTCEEDGKMEVNPSSGIRSPSKNNGSISNKVLSKEERVFLEAATLLSAAKI
eukprot:CAMPEP_0116101942 /NCGR_PEP_ID=MMETSP0327-20121206/13079_1 /TAXON_ID=44447 /ORGANISM="Pseudo-nitzschia delicatissima, Strain B596" /LENGTH=243 /DNA_ID=CAMNT_0003593937 /DNA_START=9 /DNA_END=740 /DNA_ORIENTATION=-